MDKGEKILEVKYRPFSFFDYAASMFLVFIAIILIYAIHSPTAVSSLGYVLGWLLSIGLLWASIGGYLLADRDSSFVLVYENGVFSKRFPLSRVQFVPWTEIRMVKENGSAVIFIPYDVQAYNKKLNFYYKIDAVFFSCPIFLRFSNRGGGFYDVDATHFVNICSTALENYRAKHGIKS